MNLQEQIDNARSQLGTNLIIFGHHYQNDKVIRHADKSGDSLELARLAQKTKAEHIVFCGVHFMGESAALLAKEGQKIYLPEPNAGCIMARMAPAKLLDNVMQRLTAKGQRVIPLTYVNSSMAIKAVCGKYNGSVCTSSNAETMLSWALEQGDAALFVPDKNLGRNTAKLIGLPQSKQHIINITKGGKVLEELEEHAKSEQARLLLWPGCCAIHARFHVEHINKLRNELPDIQIIVHPECRPEVVAAANFAGSTSALIKYVDSSPKGSKIAIGTEINLVNRLRDRYAGEKNISPLTFSNCAHMGKVTEQKLAATLESIIKGTAQPLRLDPSQADNAHKALQVMMDVCKL